MMKNYFKILNLLCRKAHLPALALLALLTGLNAHADVVIDETTFPDENFRNYILSQPYGADGVLTDAEIGNVKEIFCSNKNIASLAGIGYFYALEALHCSNNQLTSLDISKNTALTGLICSSNKLTELDVSNNTVLKDIHCGVNLITTLDLSKNTELTNLECSYNQLIALNVSNNPLLREIDCYRNQLPTLDVSSCAALAHLDCGFNQLPALDVRTNTNLFELDCSDNQLTTLDVSKNTKLIYFWCQNNHLTELDLSANTELSLPSYLNYMTQTRELIAQSAVTPDGENFYYFRLDDNTDGDKSIVERMTETNFGGVESKFDPSRVLEWTDGTIVEGQKRVATTAEDVDPQNVTGKILLLSNVTEDPETNTASGFVSYKYNVNNTRDADGSKGGFTLNWTAPIPSNPHTAVTDLRNGREEVGVTYTNLAGQTSDKPFDGVNIVVTRFDDGTTQTTKLIR